MKGICNEEKNLKRYLKNHVSLNVETMVKFLITGIIGVSLTACGGGGGGGGSSDSKPPVVGPEDPKPEPPVTPPVVEEIEVNKNNETHEVTNSNSIITGTIAGTQDGFTALKAVNSTVENKATISVTGDGSIGIHGTTDTALFSTRANHIVTNSGTISTSGNESIGMLIENGVTGINKGILKVSGELSSAAKVDKNSSFVNQGEIQVEGSDLGNLPEDSDTAKRTNGITSEGFVLNDKSGNILVSKAANGILVKGKDAQAINKGLITVVAGEIKRGDLSTTRGMLALDAAQIINEGSIVVIDGDVTGSGGIAMRADAEGSLAINKGKIEIETNKSSYGYGMEARDGGKIVNEGKINLLGKGSGMRASDNSTAINNGGIELESSKESGQVIIESDESYVILQDEKLTTVTGITGIESTVINNKDIKLFGQAVGMEVYKKGKGTNNGNIELISEKIDSRGYSKGWIENDQYDWLYKEVGITYSELIGMIAKNSELENTKSGTISLKGTGVGVKALSNSVAINNGDIIVESEAESWSDTGYVGEPDPTEGEWLFWSPITGMEANESKIVNNGKIEVINDGQGMKAENNSSAVNNGDILISSKTEGENGEPIGWDYHVIGMELAASEGVNNGNIVIEGSAEQKGVSLDKDSNFINKGKIEVETKNNYAQGISDWGYGYQSLGKEIINDGIIRVFTSKEIDSESTAYIRANAVGISSDRNIINSGEIYAETDGGTATGIKSSFNDREITNSETGKIVVVGDNSIGIKANNESNGSGVLGKVSIINDGLIAVNGKSGDDSDNSHIPTGIQVFNYSETNRGLITNNGKIEVESSDDARGIDAYGNDVINNGIINVNGIDSTGIRVQDLASTATNNGTINVYGTEALGIYVGGNAKAINNGTINIEGKYADGIRISDYNSEYESSIENNGFINVSGDNAAKYITGINANGVNSIINNNEIVVTKTEAGYENENEVTGIFAIGKSSYNPSTGYNEYEKVTVENNGLINVVGSDSDMTFGIEAVRGEIKNSKNGVISVTADSGAGGIVGGDSNIINDGTIVVTSEKATGINTYRDYHYNENLPITITNNGKIEVEGNNSKGIRISGNNSTATNLGTINIDGEGSYGMYAENGAIIINGVELEDKEAQKNTGVINVGASAASGMYAGYNSKAINYGTINIESGNSNAGSPVTDNLGNSISSAAMNTNGGIIENHGTINTDTNLTINSINGGAYVIGTSEDGSYGKISAKNVSIDGDVVVSAGITKNGFKNEYTMQNVVDAEDIKLGDNFNFTSNSLLYDAEAVTDRWGNLDATLSRNNKNLSDFTKGYIASTAKIFGKYQNEESFKALSSDAKEVIKAIDTSSVESIDETLNGLTPTIYANLGRQILETSETFKEQDMVAINSLGENSYNFTFIGEYQDVDSRDNIEGYKSKMTGFVGAMNFGDGTFGTIGYGYNDIDYKDNGKGHIQTIHLGLNRFGKYEGVDYNFGLGGEYNFHENKRDIDLLGRKAESDFDSYGVRASGEISKVFGKEAYVKPYLGLDLAHMKYDSFTESKANTLNANIESENYTSVLPKVGLLVGDRFGGLNIFAGVEYSYELGNMDKEQNFSYEGFEGTAKLPKDDLESGTTGVKAGASYEVNNFRLGASIGKNFGRRDNSFASLSLGYSF